ncbi:MULTISPECIES: ABC transporter permease [Shouchella]|uniref:Oligopeptide transport system permease protein AppB n=3 Tax=Bacillaceae TaxID=186817 RepID=A0A060M1T0_9BACI|nr:MULTISPECIES: ABC transporter permease [Bacillaceae]RQW18994.1 ABC transporter permease [Bacillus sp. C1-1]AIC96402.1 Oligopeptide transport system permease protein AppB [Shouchella lehensis G1]KQL57390.1 ABC transporter permease [Alkalicoccobacillus plakortidis]MBG9785268.1 ABC transporter permease [Shouchella lehensis]TES46713.1 ABC transporter permease [Shouchella lehensis]
MGLFLLKRLAQIIPVLLIISFIVFALVFIAGNPVALMLPDDASQEDIAQLTASLGLDKPFIVQYGHYLLNLIQGDFGESFRYSTSALPLVLERLPATLELAIAAMIIAVTVAIPLGIWSATQQNTPLDLLASGGAVLGKAMPNFWLGIMLILLFSVTLGWLPVSGRGTFAHLLLPAITLATGIAAEITRLLRSNMIEILNQDYIRTAKSKGIRNLFVVYKHAFRNSLIPLITITALQTSTVVGGTLITETVFSWPGLGQLLIQAVNTRDMAIVQACVFVIAILVILMNLLADILYRLLDPRIKYD